MQNTLKIPEIKLCIYIYSEIWHSYTTKKDVPKNSTSFGIYTLSKKEIILEA